MRVDHVPRLLKRFDQVFVRTAAFRVGYAYGTIEDKDLEELEREADDGDIERWHRLFAHHCRVRSAYSFGAGRMAFYAILKALEIQPGDEVVIPAYTCVAVPNAIVFAGGRPVYADIDPDTFNVDVADVKRKISPRTRVVVAQHTFGLPADLHGLKEITEDRADLALVEDGCLAIGAGYRGSPVGSWGDAAFFSTDATKMICTDIGGIAVTSDPRLEDRLADIWAGTPEMPGPISQQVRRQFEAKYRATRPDLYWRVSLDRILRRNPLSGSFSFTDEYDGRLPSRYAYPARFLRAMVHVAIRQLTDIERNVAHRRWVAERLNGLFDGCRRVTVPDGIECTWLRYPLRVDDPHRWRKVFDKYVEVGDWFNSPAYGWKRDMSQMGYIEGSCPVAESVHRQSINFPTHYLMDERALGKLEELWLRHRRELN